MGGVLFAQNQIQECFLWIEPDFNSECMITGYNPREEFLPRPFSEDSECNMVCKNSRVRYTVHGTSGIYHWNVQGGTILQNIGNVIIVSWGNVSSGLVTVTVEIDGVIGICSAELCVELVEPPTVASISTPAYYLLADGTQVIDVCRGQTISFTDMSLDNNGIASIQWNAISYNISGFTSNFEITPTQPGVFYVEHTAKNNCGCSSIERYQIRVNDDDLKFEMSCYGTVCENSTHTYTLINPTCTSYNWNVQGGTFTQSSQNSPTITVNWNNPPSDGYGIISIDLNPCNTNCALTNSIKIPIITSTVNISGPTTVCEDDVFVYSVPLWGATSYQWSICGYMPNGNMYCLPIIYGETINEIVVLFPSLPAAAHVSSYTITVKYENEFLGCSGSATLTVDVKPKLIITASSTNICVGDTVKFESNTTDANPANWTINNNPQTSASSFNHSFPNPGTYIIAASNSAYCNQASIIVTVNPAPPPIPYDSIFGPHVACPNTSITLTATPTSSQYSLVWKPVCSNDIFYGDSVSIAFADEVCNVLVYQRDIITGCMSQPTTDTIKPFTLTHFDIDTFPLCAGQTQILSAPTVSGEVMYLWSINPINAASVVGSDISPTVTVIANHVQNSISPYVTVTLKRTYCVSVEIYDYYILKITNLPPPQLTYDTVICAGQQASFFANNLPLNATSFQWNFNGQIGTTNPYQRYFDSSGIYNFTFQYSVDDCTSSPASGSINVKPTPSATISSFQQNSTTHLSVPFATSATYLWSTSDITNVINTNNVLGTYCCTVTLNGCQNYSCITLLNSIIPDTCQNITLYKTAISPDCNKYSITVVNPPQGLQQLNWAISPNSSYNNITTPSFPSTTATFGLAGQFTVIASGKNPTTGECYNGSIGIDIDYVPHVSYSMSCSNILTVSDISHYIQGFDTATVTRTVNVVAGSYTNSRIFGPTQDTLQFDLSTVSTNSGTITLTIGSYCTVTIPFNVSVMPIITQMSIIGRCESTPILFEAAGTNVSYFKWDFGDSSYNFGNSIYHTYDTVKNYTVTLTAYNLSGCTASSSQTITISPNNIIGTLEQSGPDLCMGQARLIYWDQNILASLSYNWSTQPYNSGAQHYVYNSGDYFVTITSSIGCIEEKVTNVNFINRPTAKIFGSTQYCEGDSVKLYSYAGENITYLWQVAGLTPPPIYTQNLSLLLAAGNYQVTLTVSNADGCSSMSTTNIIIHPKPNPPSISLSADSHCIHQPPISVYAPAGVNLHWSNGYYGNPAYFYNAGFISAYQTDNYGCQSDNTLLYICPAPNFDALLTGCYERCPAELPDSVPLYTLIPTAPYFGTNFKCESPRYTWNFNGVPFPNIINVPISYTTYLPIPSFGNYTMTVNYGDNCTVESTRLTISEKDCDDPCGTVEYCYVKCCEVYFTQIVRICNYGTQPITYTQLIAAPGHTVMSWSPNPLIIQPGKCEFVTVTVRVDDFSQTIGHFSIISQTEEGECSVEFELKLDWTLCVEENTCEVRDAEMVYDPVASIPYQTSYFDLSILLPNGTTGVIDFWTEPQVILNYNYNQPYLTGKLIFNYAQLKEMAEKGESVCFYLLICIDMDYLCLLHKCIPAKDIFNIIYSNPDDKELSKNVKEIKKILLDFSSKNSNLSKAYRKMPSKSMFRQNTQTIQTKKTKKCY